MRVFLTGATGLIGGSLVAALEKRGDEPLVLSRDVERAKKKLGAKVEVVQGIPQQEGEWMSAVSGCQAIINLAGEPVFAKRWNDLQKTELRNSRIITTWNLVKAIERAASRPSVLVSTSAIGFYGNVPNGELDEQSPQGGDFLARLCADWEAAAVEAERLNVRVVLCRVGIVLDPHEGALKQMLPPFKLGVGGPIGRGRQMMSWVHIDDVVGIFLKALDDPQAKGPMNVTAPEPVSNKQFSQNLAGALERPCLFPVPPFVLHLMLGGAAELVTGGQCVLPKQAEKLGYRFKYRTCAAAMQALFGEHVGA